MSTHALAFPVTVFIRRLPRLIFVLFAGLAFAVGQPAFADAKPEEETPRNLSAGDLPYQKELRGFEAERGRDPRNPTPLLMIAEIKSMQAKTAGPELRIQLLREALDNLEKARKLSPSALLRERVLLEMAVMRVEVGASLSGEARQAAFTQAADDYLKADENKLLRSVESYTPSVGWVMTLACMAGEQRLSGISQILLDEAIRLAGDSSFINVKTSEQHLFLVEAMLLCASLTADARQSQSLLQSSLERIALAESLLKQPSDGDYRNHGGMIRMYRAMAFLMRAANSKGDARRDGLREMTASLLGYISRMDHYPGYEARQFAEERAELLWNKAEKTLGGEPLFLSSRALWDIVFFKEKKDLALAREMLRKAAELAPREELVWNAYDLAISRDRYDKTFENDGMTVHTHQACLAQNDVSGWIRWIDTADRAVGHTGAKEYPAQAKAVMESVRDLDKKYSCPGFAAFAEGVLEQKRNAEGYARAIELYEKAAGLQRPAAADALIYGNMGDTWHNADRHSYPKRNMTAEERLDLQARARAAYQKSFSAYVQAREQFDFGKRSRYDADFPWRANYAETLSGLMENPARPLDKELLDETFACTAKSCETPDSATLECLSDWVRFLRSSIRHMAWQYRGTQGESRRRELLDLALNVYPRMESLGDASAHLYMEWADARLQRARLASYGERAELLRGTVGHYEKALSDKKKGEGYQGLFQARLLLCAESPIRDIPDLMRQAYAEFCLAAGLPQNTPRSKQYWIEIVRQAALAAPAEIRDAMIGSV